MKCPECGHNQKHKYGMTCSCGYQFALDPKRDQISDARFLALVANASSNDTYYFTKNQLATAYCRRELKGCGSGAGLAVFMAIGGVMVAMALFAAQAGGGMGWGILLALGLLVILGSGWRLLFHRPNRKVMEAAIRKWHAAGRRVPRLLLKPSLHQPPPEWEEPDIYDYGVESILIVERDILVDLFVKNGFHASQRCLVVSETGYPSYIAGRVETLLREQPDLPVYLLHDATRHGGKMIERVERQLQLPPRDRPFIDLGLFPVDVQRIRRLRPLLPAKDDYAIPLDYIGYGMLLSGLSQAFEEQVALAAVLDTQQAGGYESVSFG
ncbi:hypothetical protein NG895_01855 [Aeoliella sp. ICT_H6.2]|uniref:Topoisomerase 6 subunit A/Spo11 TOPRIM domain-containing protein n=1 Tax=Aeoliella straminimaris TaxID=2954799 RepID=A0A9X2JE57_9BACT|nr:hypothetical protein [Aeoliella straminimaris]MCO6042640.1 hypothetical protein [Aeoliella straminimaris]